jgi:hypothetical protein
VVASSVRSSISVPQRLVAGVLGVLLRFGLLYVQLSQIALHVQQGRAFLGVSTSTPVLLASLRVCRVEVPFIKVSSTHALKIVTRDFEHSASLKYGFLLLYPAADVFRSVLHCDSF